GRASDFSRQRSDFLLQARLLGVHQGDASGQYHAHAPAQLVANRGKPLGFGGLALQAVHLPRHFVEDVIHAGQVLLGALQAQLGEALLVFESGNAGGLFDDGAAVVRLGAEQLANALLADDGVALGTEAGAHEDVLNVAQPAELAVQQIFAFAGAEETPGDDNFALLRRSVELAPADFQNHRLRPFRGGGFLLRLFRCTLVFDYLAGLL